MSNSNLPEPNVPRYFPPRGKSVVTAFFLFLATFIPPFIAWAVVPFIRWDKEPSTGSWDDNPVIRGDLPKWAMWMQTIDERMPGGLYEPTVRKFYDKWGKTLCSLYWIGFRNRAHGLRGMVGFEVSERTWLYKYSKTEYSVSPDGVWREPLILGSLTIFYGYWVYRIPGPDKVTYWATPRLAFKKTQKDA